MGVVYVGWAPDTAEDRYHHNQLPEVKLQMVSRH